MIFFTSCAQTTHLCPLKQRDGVGILPIFAGAHDRIGYPSALRSYLELAGSSLALRCDRSPRGIGRRPKNRWFAFLDDLIPAHDIEGLFSRIFLPPKNILNLDLSSGGTFNVSTLSGGGSC